MDHSIFFAYCQKYTIKKTRAACLGNFRDKLSITFENVT